MNQHLVNHIFDHDKLGADSSEQLYWERKNLELDWLRSIGAQIPQRSPHDYFDLIDFKRKARVSLLLKNYSSLSQMTESCWELSCNPAFNFTYQRFDLRPSSHEFNAYGNKQEVYPMFFTSSGMSAICSFFIALSQIFEGMFNLQGMPGRYFETTRLLAKLKINISDNNNHKIFQDKTVFKPESKYFLYLDTIAKHCPFDQIQDSMLECNYAVIIDTTCESRQSEKLWNFINRCINKSIPCVLIRSHLKLDSLGLEFARLGSIAFVLPHLLSTERADLIRQCIKTLPGVIAETGATFLPSALFPGWRSASFDPLNELRIHFIKKANSLVVQYINETNSKLHECIHLFWMKRVFFKQTWLKTYEFESGQYWKVYE
ncbi:MAG: hypothetical protein HY072_06110 [Deltaproteobacteria bacterium]|nr:hypothetical protein [Deltaproteobacteria bacterium]